MYVCMCVCVLYKDICVTISCPHIYIYTHIHKLCVFIRHCAGMEANVVCSNAAISATATLLYVESGV